ncbi:adenylate/guanylate cyclase domain-containing protein [Ruegeria arenilitoris]|uniref:adenylate/guanylate cyclase domain-containing protein n=1 Tax=Ruegeria arenilitoris TaxID=1173585 RepID=UPI00147C3E12|nr:adenylate/guanylate cyclase domain-containing protein [Ruegeria arenilitoris]
MAAVDTDSAKSNDLINWLVTRGLEGTGEHDLLDGYCRKLLDLDVPLMRFHSAQPALHPAYGGTGYSWYHDQGGDFQTFDYSETPSQQWRQSPLYAILNEGLDAVHERLVDQNTASRFPLINELREKGATEYYATGINFGAPAKLNQLGENRRIDGALMSWATNAPKGFQPQDLSLIVSSLPHLGLALKSASSATVARDLMRVYLGSDAGQRVLSGEIRRGSLQQIDAVVWNFDLEGFTGLSEELPGLEIIDMLNDYLAVAVDVVHEFHGSILKFMGDGLMAIFDVGEIDADARAALNATAALQKRMAELNTRRLADSLPVTNFTLALHAGEILYGNIGAESRLDFTVIGPTVNQAARIAGMHRSLGQRILLSDDVARAAQPCEHDLVSVGRYMLRGVAEPKELFTIHRL